MKLLVRPVDFDDPMVVNVIAEAANLLGQLGIGVVSRYGRLHVEADGFRGLYNCIAIYWSEDGEYPCRGLTDEEMTILNRDLARRLQGLLNLKEPIA